MANRNLNSKQFGEGLHNEVISGLEEHHGVEFTPMGLRHSENRMAPIADVWASNDAVSREEPSGYSMGFTLPTEDPDVLNTLELGYPKTGPDDKLNTTPTGVQTEESHVYRDSGKTAYRFTDHADITSAMEHLAQAAQERAGHLEKGTVPGDVSPHLTTPNISGKWSKRPMSQRLLKEGPDTTPLEPPNVISYFSNAQDWSSDDSGVDYKVDTGTRERIPDKDQ